MGTSTTNLCIQPRLPYLSFCCQIIQSPSPRADVLPGNLTGVSYHSLHSLIFYLITHSRLDSHGVPALLPTLILTPSHQTLESYDIMISQLGVESLPRMDTKRL